MDIGASSAVRSVVVALTASSRPTVSPICPQAFAAWSCSVAAALGHVRDLRGGRRVLDLGGGDVAGAQALPLGQLEQVRCAPPRMSTEIASL
jgi:hypothetical protein